MNKKILFLVLSVALLASCKQPDGTKKENDSTEKTSVVETTVDNNTPVQQLNNEQIATAQKEYLKVLSVKDESIGHILEMGQSIGGAKPDEQKIKQLQGQIYQLSLGTQEKLNKLKITNQEVKDYIKAQNDLVDLTEKIHKVQDKIEKEQKDGKLSESNEALLKETQEAQGKVLQKELKLTENLAQSGEANPAKELLQIKNIQNKEALQLASLMQMLMSDTASDAEKAKKMIDLSKEIADNSIAELNKLSIQTPEVNDYRKQLVELFKLKFDSISQSEKMQKELAEHKKLSPENEKLILKLQEDTLKAEKLRMELTAKYSQ